VLRQRRDRCEDPGRGYPAVLASPAAPPSNCVYNADQPVTQTARSPARAGEIAPGRASYLLGCGAARAR